MLNSQRIYKTWPLTSQGKQFNWRTFPNPLTPPQSLLIPLKLSEKSWIRTTWHLLYEVFFFLIKCSFFFSPFNFISWRLITLQYCGGFCHILTWISHGSTCVPHPNPPSRHPSGSSQCTRPEHLSHASNLGWRSVSSLIEYLFQCYSLRTSHPRLLPQLYEVLKQTKTSNTLLKDKNQINL